MRLRSYVKALDSLSRINLMHALQMGGSATVEQLAATTGLHANTTREHLKMLIAVGLVRADPILRGRRGRPALTYRAVMGQIVATGARQAEALDEHFGRCGFDATIAAGAGCVTVRDCPFARLSEGNPQVCEVHRTLIADALASSAGPLRAGELRRLVTEHECTLELVV
ncbi:MAG: helix-turn-helix domain-containing protein [Microbacteriaceae bacterium]|nr:helix-turn-helix domain-containing protein [Microbacteriaceae bacterium]